MTEAWFTPEAAQYFTLVSVLSFTALAAPLIARGKHRAAIFALWISIVCGGAVMALAGAVAFHIDQPAHVSMPLLITGAVIVAAYSFSLFFVWRVYRAAEHRKVAAREL